MRSIDGSPLFGIFLDHPFEAIFLQFLKRANNERSQQDLDSPKADISPVFHECLVALGKEGDLIVTFYVIIEAHQCDLAFLLGGLQGIDGVNEGGLISIKNRFQEKLRPDLFGGGFEGPTVSGVGIPLYNVLEVRVVFPYLRKTAVDHYTEA